MEKCTSCHGDGELGTDNGPVVCPDCFGEGRQLGSIERTEWRLRDIERAHQIGTHGCQSDVRWLVHELRRTREALVQILSRCQEHDDDRPQDSQGDGERNIDGHGHCHARSHHGAGKAEGASAIAADVQFVANRALGLYVVKSSVT